MCALPFVNIYRFFVLYQWFVTIVTSLFIYGRAYWAGQAVTRPLFVPNGHLLLIVPLFCLQFIFLLFHIEL